MTDPWVKWDQSKREHDRQYRRNDRRTWKSNCKDCHGAGCDMCGNG